MKILIFSLAYHPIMGGAEVAIKELTDRMPDVEFDMVTLKFSQSHPYYQKIGNIGVYRIGGGYGYLSKVLFIPRAVYEGLKLQRKNKYDLFWAVMTYMTFPIVFIRLLGNRTPYAISLLDKDPFEPGLDRVRARILKFLLDYAFRHAKKVQASSDLLAEWASEHGFEGGGIINSKEIDKSLFE